ncbi:hypothetical protein W97_04383 [Coniosporium apollinis CBS 100218]|uniref:Zn(2)-C6 fungal-type domain-containing protein n=1 Tax=Coniosporium apollinis (strain CBS 100218) TaxID=1168221 RepID=R7YU15_CONA1|nr:uncharacterized protein W97_04383 [Coniosporium apollinis CBS 100218]EON65146.1 hypothetical protein W97_04383 [Coniosporium apollinis CBS 100218]
MATPRRTSSDDFTSAEGSVRKRVCKACDRCRLKKSKCDGASPCSRCKADNAICVFSERKKSHDKVYPKGYVEMLEQQQGQLVAGLRELYRRLQSGEGWPGSPLPNAQNGHPLTHNILERLDLLHLFDETISNYEGFEEDCTRMQQRLLEGGAQYGHRRGSISSDSEHELSSISSLGTPSPQALSFNSSFTHGPQTPHTTGAFSHHPLPNCDTPGKFHPHLSMQPTMRIGVDPAAALRSPWAVDAPSMGGLSNTNYLPQFEPPMGHNPSDLAYDPFAQILTSTPITMAEWNDGADMDFSNFITT